MSYLMLHYFLPHNVLSFFFLKQCFTNISEQGALAVFRLNIITLANAQLSPVFKSSKTFFFTSTKAFVTSIIVTEMNNLHYTN
uniref:Uncharacterized protein n=1 Tax=Anguilla anguilla TaxID=7936 RepID=A0A0E9PJZ4_ANGAN